MENRTSTKLQAKEIIKNRKKLDSEIMKLWKELRNDAGSHKNFMPLYNDIMRLQNKRVVIKGMLMYLNENRKTFDYESFKNTNNYSIFAACESKEAIAQLKLISGSLMLNAKDGDSNAREERAMTCELLASLIESRQKEADDYDTAMERFNKDTYLDVNNLCGDFSVEFLT